MPPTISSSARARGAAVRQARAARVRMIRRRVGAGALALFVATWLLITVILVTGHDPALARQRSTTVAATQSASPSSTTSTGASSATSTTSGSSTSSGTSAVTSSQS